MISTEDRESEIQSYVRKVHDEVVSVSLLGGLYDLLLRHVRSAISDVFSDGGGKEDGLLAHHADHLSQVADVKCADIVAINKYLKSKSQTDTQCYFLEIVWRHMVSNTNAASILLSPK